MGKAGKRRSDAGTVRKSFLWHPCEDTAKAIELLCEQCDISANATITLLAEYGLRHMKLQSRTVQEIRFEE